MDMQATPPTYTPVGAGQTPMGNPPVLGQQVPGMSGGLPAQGGLSVLANPMAQQLQSMGRDDDSVLVHMTPDEVNSLQGLAMSAGGSLTINPQTGLPEAFFLKKLLPTLLGVGLAATGIGAPLAAGIVATGSTALTGNLRKGLMAGLGAFGGASLAGAAGLGGAISKTGFNTLGAKPGVFGANMGAGLGGTKAAVGAAIPTGEITLAGAKPAVAEATRTATMGIKGLGVQGQTAAAVAPKATATLSGNVLGMQGSQIPANLVQQATQDAALQGAIKTSPSLAKALAGPIKTPGALGQFGQRFAETARGGMTGLAGKAAPYAAGMGVLSSISDATTPSFRTPGGQIDNSYEGPYTFEPREVAYRSESPVVSRDSSPELFFQNSQPGLRNLRGELVQPGSSTAPGTMIRQAVLNPRARKGEPMYTFRNVPFMGVNPDEEGRFAEGGTVDMRDGSFVVDARTVSEIGNGSSNAGIEALARMGGRPVRGPGDGVSDSVKASIGGRQEARVARDEVIFPPEAVRRLGGGSDAKGTKKLYAMMDKAHKARKKAKRGQDTAVRKGLA